MKKLIFTFLALAILVVVGWYVLTLQPTVYLMPTPVLMTTGDLNPFSINPNLDENNEIRLLYATNRVPAGTRHNRTYTVLPGKNLSMGMVHMQIGETKTPWHDLLNLSTTANSGSRPALKLDNLEELAQYPLQESVATPDSERAFIDVVNRALENALDKNLTIYVHGANTNIYRASSQAAQYQHFTGRNSVVMVYLWPSAENVLGYGTDTRHAAKTAPAFARLVTLLDRHSQAHSINIIAYSAGAKVVSPALAIIGNAAKVESADGIRIGEVYFAAADIGVSTFVRHLKSYVSIPNSTTMAMNMQDSVLALSAMRNRESRVGSPKSKDLSADEIQWIQKQTNRPTVAIVGVSPQTVTGLGSRSHDFWYSHPWVSSDVLTQLVLHKRPDERGLLSKQTETGLRYWVFPTDYPEIIVGIVDNASEDLRRRARAEREK